MTDALLDATPYIVAGSAFLFITTVLEEKGIL
jgi:hypothetical protein